MVSLTNPNHSFFSHRAFTFVSSDPAYGDRFVCVLDTVASAFDTAFPDVQKQSLSVMIRHTDEDPVCYKVCKLIFLDVEPMYWCQAAFQFSHELCHYMIPEGVPRDLKWLEEVVCETASLFFLPIVEVIWHSSPSIPHQRYAHFFSSYKEDLSKQIRVEDLTSQSVQQHLQIERYDRKLNRYIASLFLPSFSETPQLWTCIPSLARIPSGLSVVDAIRKWSSVSPDNFSEEFNHLLHLFVAD